MEDNKPFILGRFVVCKCQNITNGLRCLSVIKYEADKYPICDTCFAFLQSIEKRKHAKKLRLRLNK